MSYIYKNITGNSETTLISAPSGKVLSINLANVHASDSVNINLYVTFRPKPATKRSIPRGNDWTVDSDPTTTSVIYLFKNLTIPFANTLILHKEDIFYNSDNYSLVIKLSASDSAVDVIVNAEEEPNNQRPAQSLRLSNNSANTNIY